MKIQSSISNLYFSNGVNTIENEYKMDSMLTLERECKESFAAEGKIVNLHKKQFENFDHFIDTHKLNYSLDLFDHDSERLCETYDHRFRNHVLAEKCYSKNYYEENAQDIQSLIFTSLIFNFLEKGEPGVHALKFFKGFCTFVPQTLLNGYIYFKKYAGAFSCKFNRISDIVKVYLTCCIISRKFQGDIQLPNDEMIRGWDISNAEINYLEAFIFNTLDYNLHISRAEYRFTMHELHHC